MSYWNNQGRYESDAEQLSLLVPPVGKCDTHKGEVWRAATKIYHDYFNNGFGNTWREAAEFLMDNIDLPKAVESILLEHANGNVTDGMRYDEQMEQMINSTIEQLKEQADRPNTVDMWEYHSTKYRQFAEEYAYDDYDDYDDY